MQTPHLLESLAPKVTSLSQADPETLGNSKVCLHYTLASHKLKLKQLLDALPLVYQVRMPTPGPYSQAPSQQHRAWQIPYGK